MLRGAVASAERPTAAHAAPSYHSLPCTPLPCSAVVVIGLTAVLLSIYRAEAQQRARLLRCVRQQQAEERAQLRSRGPQPARAAASAGAAAPGGTSGAAAAGTSGDAPPAGPAGSAPLSPASLRQSGAALRSLPLAAQQRAHVWLLAAAFVYILWSSWPAMSGPLPPAVDGM